ncbi:hypothetical protein E4U45_005400 [Claviceps purpurea]|nr:hypothetical protein E4U45_005400 [Claviceps purpurea]
MGTDGPGLVCGKRRAEKNTAKGGEHRALGSRAEDGFKKAGALLKRRPPGEGGYTWDKDVETKAWEVDADAEAGEKSEEATVGHESHDDDGSKSNGFGHAPQVKKLLPRPTSPSCGAKSDGEL